MVMERNMNLSMDVIKIIAFVAEPIIDRGHYTYTLVFSVDKSNIKWKVTHQFSRFKVLHLLIRKLAAKIIFSKFPKDSTTTMLGLRLSKKAVDNRRLMLEMWIREVVANFEIFPGEIVASLNDFVKAPKRINTVSAKNFNRSASAGDLSHAYAPLHSDTRKQSAPNILSTVEARGFSYDSGKSQSGNKKKMPIIEIIIRIVMRTISWIELKVSQKVASWNDRNAISTICLSRSDKLTMNRSNGNVSSFVRDMRAHFTVYSQLFFATTLLNKIFGFFFYKSSGTYMSPTAVVFFTSLLMFVHLQSRDYITDDELSIAYRPSYLLVQESLRTFLNAPSLEYTDKIYTFPSFLAFQNNSSRSSKSDSSEETYSSDEDPLGTHSSDDSPFRNSPEDAAFIPATAAEVKIIAAKAEPRVLHESLVPGSTFDNVEFVDLCPEARAMYSDRSETHTMKVRGESYCDDNKKVNPGPAMSKLLLLELYEVEAKDGDRHDHIVSRGAAKRRLQALRTLPEKLFFICVNFQIPGDPPVSIVSYFGLPMDLIERYPGSSTAKFLKTFERFIDIPRTEKERLQAWGIITHSPDPPVPAPVHVHVQAPISTPAPEHEHETPSKSVLATSSGKELLNGSKNHSLITPLAPPPPPTPSKAPLAPLVQPSLIVPSSIKKSRLGFLHRSTGRPGSNSNTPTHRSTAQTTSSASLRNLKVTGALQDESPGPSSEKRRRARSSSFNDAAILAAMESRKEDLEVPELDTGLIMIDKGRGSSYESVNKKKTPGLNTVSADAGDLDLRTESRLRDTECVSSVNVSSISDSRMSEPKAPIQIPSHPVVAAAPTSSGWRVPSDITWPTAYDKGALPPSDFRNERFKLIPSITIGPWVVKAAVGATPALLGRKVVQRYFRGEDYLEIDIHVGSSVIASQVVGLCRGYAKNIVNDVGIVIQGEHEGELPEKILAVGSLNRINVNIRQKLD